MNVGKYRGTTAVARAFDGRRRLRSHRVSHFGSMDAVKAWPLAMCRFRPDEGGTVSTALNINLAPVSGYMRSNAYVDVVQVWVPYQAAEALELDSEDAGVTEMTKRRLMAGQGIGLADESEISRTADIKPRAVGGVKKVSKTVDLSYTAACNHLRLSAYHDAALLTKHNQVIRPAVLTANVLERFNGVLDPERHIDGAINLTGELQVKGISAIDNAAVSTTQSVDETGATAAEDQTGWNHAQRGIFLEEDPDNPGFPKVVTDLSGTSEITLRDMMQSQKLDGLIREFAQMIEDDPVNGEEKVERALYGLTCDFDANCHVLYRQVFELTPAHQRPTDGPSINDVSAHFNLNTRFATVVPRSELGGQLVTLAMVKPLETLPDQPDPAQTEAWELVNRIHDETELDEQLLTRADLDSTVAAQDEDTPVFWVGHNSLKHDYSTQGPNPERIQGVEMKSTMWTYKVPSSVTPENVNYPYDGIAMYPFHNWNGGHAEYYINQVAAISTSLAKGPNPIERIQLFADDPALVDPEA